MTGPTDPTDIQLYFLWRNHVQAQFETLGLTNTDAGGGLGGFDLGFDGPSQRILVSYQGPARPPQPSGAGVDLPEPGGTYLVSLFRADDLDTWTDVGGPHPRALASGEFLTADAAVAFTRDHLEAP
ncbi:hypothetical protein [Deinococcus soli (ex Cha et al. 2016)]|uniref:Uncharacterized protein n=2 Tax=Deinococcus soli (ex Cha et al. 2016) TaxID=1309411 RepID=A0AAE3XB95_9DEIO|nr:hypothetical protein [Deinococcus soli (ex Cha et al. 2016)]MDR6218292.1 hypothetical protein [Deinococcus soli (ex Cha et al. 2016)]MDR6329032.1 hypothetical protein [Deinococcus soli (ex Cha et al. 2016)]MDR6751305.1 hypothetical protein [Deinococcus soli (ex Cha et al. 2016)]